MSNYGSPYGALHMNPMNMNPQNVRREDTYNPMQANLAPEHLRGHQYGAIAHEANPMNMNGMHMNGMHMNPMNMNGMHMNPMNMNSVHMGAVAHQANPMNMNGFIADGFSMIEGRYNQIKDALNVSDNFMKLIIGIGVVSTAAAVYRFAKGDELFPQVEAVKINGTKKGQRRKTARRAYMKNPRRRRNAVKFKKNGLSAYQRHMKKHMSAGKSMKQAARLWQG
jgi:hypothetical protein